jgi:hypothetical protein
VQQEPKVKSKCGYFFFKARIFFPSSCAIDSNVVKFKGQGQTMFLVLRIKTTISAINIFACNLFYILPSFSNLNSCFVVPKRTQQNRMFCQNRFLFSLDPKRLMFAHIE